MEAAQHSDQPAVARRHLSTTRLLAIGAAAAAVVILWGGYGHHWPWTGINGRTATLWDWLHLLLLPVAVGILPIYLSRRNQLRRRHKASGAAVLATFAVVVIAGYAIPWGWTGFSGNKLWDWLELLALPVAVGLTPAFSDLRNNWSRQYTLIALTSLGVFAAIVIGGYVGKWAWTGFRGNTLWDWLHLLLLPLLLPTIVVPALVPVAAANLADPDQTRSGGADAGSDQTRSGGADADPDRPRSESADAQSRAGAGEAPSSSGAAHGAQA